VFPHYGRLTPRSESSSSSHFWLTRELSPFDTAPSLHSHYRSFITTTSSPAPEASHPYSRPRGVSTCGFSVNIKVSGSHSVPLHGPSSHQRRMELTDKRTSQAKPPKSHYATAQFSSPSYAKTIRVPLSTHCALR
jgi:hypothetical protein